MVFPRYDVEEISMKILLERLWITEGVKAAEGLLQAFHLSSGQNFLNLKTYLPELRTEGMICGC